MMYHCSRLLSFDLRRYLTRDVEFDLEKDRDRCLHGLNTPEEDKYSPADVRRVTEIFDNPQFFVGEASSNDIVQGALGDCWLLSALATMSTSKGLIRQCCVAVCSLSSSKALDH
jgi:hypothetical protein